MSASEKREFSIAYEIDKLRKILRIPVTDIKFDDRYEYGKLYLDGTELKTILGELYIGDDVIGIIPYVSTEWGFGYLSGKQRVLNWDKIFELCGPIIFHKIIDQAPFAVSYKMRGELSLNVFDKSGNLINTAFCDYIDDDWRVIVTGIDVVEKKVEIKIPMKLPDFKISGTM